jgi:hypothetical protein
MLSRRSAHRRPCAARAAAAPRGAGARYWVACRALSVNQRLNVIAGRVRRRHLFPPWEGASHDTDHRPVARQAIRLRPLASRRHGQQAMVETKSIKTLGKLIGVLDCFSTTDRSLTVSEIAQRSGLPRSTAHRAILALKEVGFLEQDRARDEYRLGLRLSQLGATVLNSMDLQRVARPFVEALSSMTNEGVHLCVFDGERMVFVERSARESSGSPNDTITMEISPCFCTGGKGRAGLPAGAGHREGDRLRPDRLHAAYDHQP